MTLIYPVKHLFSLLTLLFFLSLMPSPLQADEFDEISHTLCDQINGGLGALPKLPGTISTHRREGDIEQTLTIENHSHFLIRVRFHAVDQSGKVSEATIERRFFFKDFSLGGRYRFEVNHKILTLSLQDTQCTWPLGFRSSTELTKAASLFTQLITLSEQAAKEDLSLSSLAKNAGYKSLVIGPRKSTIKEAIHTLATASDKDSMVAWLSVNTADEEKKLLAEAENCLPFLYTILTSLISAASTPSQARKNRSFNGMELI
jgi:hypothetical protein